MECVSYIGRDKSELMEWKNVYAEGRQAGTSTIYTKLKFCTFCRLSFLRADDCISEIVHAALRNFVVGVTIFLVGWESQ